MAQHLAPDLGNDEENTCDRWDYTGLQVSDETLARQLAEEESASISERVEQERRDEALAREVWQAEAAQEALRRQRTLEGQKRYCLRCGTEGPALPAKPQPMEACTTTCASFWMDGPSGAMTLCQACGRQFEESTGATRQEWHDWAVALSLMSGDDDAHARIIADSLEEFVSTEDDEDEDDEDNGSPNDRDDGDGYEHGGRLMLPPAAVGYVGGGDGGSGEGTNGMGNAFQKGSGAWEPWMGANSAATSVVRLSNIYREAPTHNASAFGEASGQEGKEGEEGARGEDDDDEERKKHDKGSSRKRGAQELEDLERFMEENATSKGKDKNSSKKAKVEAEEEGKDKRAEDAKELHKKRKRSKSQSNSDNENSLQQQQQDISSASGNDSGGMKKRKIEEEEEERDSAEDRKSDTEEQEDGERRLRLSDSVENVSLFGSAAGASFFSRLNEEQQRAMIHARMLKANSASEGEATQEHDVGSLQEESDESEEDSDDEDDSEEEDEEEEEEDEDEEDEEEEENEEEDEDVEEGVANELATIDDSSLESAPDIGLSLDFSGDSTLTDIGRVTLPGALKSLNLSRTGVSGQSFERLPRNLGRLQMTQCPAIDDHSLIHIPPSLHTLDIGLCNITALGLLLIPQRLHTLVLSGCSFISNIGLQQLPRTLVSLDLSGCNQLTEEGLKHLPSSLQTLKLNRCKGVNDFLLMRQYLPPCLTTLHLGGCENVSDKGLPFLPSSLQTLNLSHNSNVSDKGILGLKCLHSHLVATNSSNSGDAQAPLLRSPNHNNHHQRIAPRCDTLKRLVLRGCPKVTGDFASNLSNVSVVLNERCRHHTKKRHRSGPVAVGADGVAGLIVRGCCSGGSVEGGGGEGTVQKRKESAEEEEEGEAERRRKDKGKEKENLEAREGT